MTPILSASLAAARVGSVCANTPAAPAARPAFRKSRRVKLMRRYLVQTEGKPGGVRRAAHGPLRFALVRWAAKRDWPAVLEAMLDVLAPSRCAGCGTSAARLCPRCIAEIARRPLERSGVAVGRITALGPYDGALRRAILALKYANAFAIGETLGELLASRLAFAADVLVPVPLHVSRRRKRGYNQAEVLAQGLLHGWRSDVCRPPRLVTDALIRARATAPQSGLGLAERLENVSLAFRAGSEALEIADRRVLLVDDVLTTGATLTACALALHAAGAASVDACCAAAKL